MEGDGKRSDQWRGRTDGNIVTVFPKRGQAGSLSAEKLPVPLSDPIKPGSLIPVHITDATVTTLYAHPD